jgi:hypothetical protein
VREWLKAVAEAFVKSSHRKSCLLRGVGQPKASTLR